MEHEVVINKIIEKWNHDNAEYYSLMLKIKDTLTPENADKIDERQYVTVLHMIYLNRFNSIAKAYGVYWAPKGMITKHGYAFLWFPQIDYDGTNEYKSRACMYYIMSYVLYLQSKNPKGWIIDFRNNSGGTIEYFVTVVALLIRYKTYSIIGVNRKGQQNSSIEITEEGIKVIIEETVIFSNPTFPFSLKEDLHNVNVLINHNTASAAEISTLILRDTIGAKIYGERSHGVVSLIQVNTYHGYSFEYPVSKLLFDSGADFITPDVEGIPEEFYPR